MVALRAPACYLSGADAREGGSLSNPRGDRMNERSERIGQHGGKKPNENVACGDPSYLNKFVEISEFAL